MNTTTQQLGTVILLATQKGGATKSSTIFNLSGASQCFGKKNQVIVDLDSQSSAVKWSGGFRAKEEKVQQLSGFMPAVTKVPDDQTLADFIELLKANFDEVYLDTAGYIDDESGKAKRILEEVVGLSDIIITPIRGAKAEVDGAIATIKFIESVLEDLPEKQSITKMVVANSIELRDKGYAYAQALLAEYNFDEFADWKLAENYISNSRGLVRNMDKGGNFVIPTRVRAVFDQYLNLYREIMETHGIEILRSTNEDISVDLKVRLTEMRKQAVKEKKAAEKAAAN